MYKLEKVIGVDILPHEHPAKGEPSFALTIVEGGRVKKRLEEVTLSKLIKLARRERPDALAVDNVFELAADINGLLKIFRLLPPTTKVIQVTKLADGEVPLEVLAASYGLTKGGKLSPLEASEVIAKLAHKGVGSLVSLFENETRIIIARSRSLGQGGMSSNRYKRNISGLILRATRKIEEALTKNQIDYDLFFKKGSYGLSGSLFIVYAPRERLYGIVKPERGHDLKILIRLVPKKNIEYLPLKGDEKVAVKTLHRNYLIVGVDPGIETGLAILTVFGKPVLITSGRSISRNQLVETITSYGIPLMIATDVNPPSLYVKKLASSLNSILYTPPRDMTVAEKRRVVREFLEGGEEGVKVLNSHQRDALAAALKALGSIKEKMERIKEELSRSGLNLPPQEVLALVLRGKTIKEAIEELGREKPKEVRREIVTKAKEEKMLEEELRRKIRIIEELRRRNNLLLEELRNKEKEIEELKMVLEKALGRREWHKKDRELLTLEERIKELSREVESLKEENEKLKEELRGWKELTLRASKGELICLKIIDNFTPSKLNALINREKKEELLAVRNFAVLNKEIANKLSKAGVKGLIVLSGHVDREVAELLEERAIALIRGDEVDYKEFEGYALMDRGELERLFQLKLKKAEEKRLTKLKQELKETICKYRKKRVKELSDEEAVYNFP